MIPKMFLTASGLALVLLTAAPAQAAKRDHLGDFRDWSTFKDVGDDGKRTCYMTSLPQSSRADKPDAKRGSIYIMVAHWPDAKVKDQVRVSGGYPYKENSDVVATIDGRAFKLYPRGENAWTYPDDDIRVVAAMKSGSKLVIVGESSRGTKTTDSFSLSGFTAAYNAITKACR